MGWLRYAAVAALIWLAGCAGTDFEWDAARKLKVGMTSSEVEKLIGPPNSVKSTPNGMLWVWVHVNTFAGTSRTLSVPFKDGKVAEVPQIPESFK